MVSNELNDYFIWLCELVYDEHYFDTTRYRALLRQMYGTEFRYDNRSDANRAADGRDLRGRFCYERGYDSTEVERYLDVGNASVLEVLVALSVRCEDQFMEDLAYGNRTSKWFSDMIDSLELDCMYDSRYNADHVADVLNCFMDRMYDRDGRGGLFISNDGTNMRELDIWYQMCHYICELQD